MRYKVILSYDGSKYHGWQKQKGSITIQEVIESFLTKIHKTPIIIYGSGRTDRGVHALKQVFHFDSSLNIDENTWLKMFNNAFNEDINVIQVERTKDDFHARFNALFKEYQYKVNVGYIDIFTKDYIYQLNKNLDLGKLKEAAMIFMGTHDFSAFNATKKEEIEDQKRTIYKFDIHQEDNLIIFNIKGNGFLRYMVRMLVGTCIDYALDKITIEDIKNALKSGDKNALNCIVPPNGLYLKNVIYPKDLMTLSLEELWHLFPISLVNHNETWVEQFNKEKIQIDNLLNYQYPIHHIGSTAIENIKAKNIVDILILTDTLEQAYECADILSNHGYRLIYKNETKVHLNKGYNEDGFGNEVFHIHIQLKDNIDELYFVRYLQKYPKIAKEYEQLKLDLESQYQFDRDGYTESKTEFINDIVIKAKLENII